MQSVNSGTLSGTPSSTSSGTLSSGTSSVTQSADIPPGKTRLRTILSYAILGTLSAFAASAVQAHHAFATEFDASRPLTFKGKVTKVELINPHSWIHIEVLDDSGTPVIWMIEGGSPNALVRRGVTKASIPVGSELIVTGYQARDGSHKAVGRDIAFADGRELFFEGSRAPGGDNTTP